jgi:hypothetical protein
MELMEWMDTLVPQAITAQLVMSAQLEILAMSALQDRLVPQLVPLETLAMSALQGHKEIQLSDLLDHKEILVAQEMLALQVQSELPQALQALKEILETLDLSDLQDQ